ncbi:MAG: glutathione S-transferase family protein [Gammaproteobacteria bacterium]|nr:glutathione S-transferase family protein [Gammaproteobacteria bacterium]
MSLMQNGKLLDDWLTSETENGEFVRKDSQFRHWVTVDGSAGPSGNAGFKAEPGRYHLYVSYACPWAHRTLIFRKLKQLDDVISVSVVHPHMDAKGWDFHDYPGATGDSLYGAEYMHELYSRADPDYSGIVTVPVLWDKHQHTIVNNESSEIIRMLNSAFDAWGDTSVDLYPQTLRGAIDTINQQVYDGVNNRVYQVGFAQTQSAYEHNVDSLFATLDDLDNRLSRQRYLTGERITEADWRLFPTLIRFDAVYVGHFKCNLRRIADYPNLFNYLLELYQWPGIAETVNFDHIKQHYYYSHPEINPTRIVPKGPLQDLGQAHNRNNLKR